MADRRSCSTSGQVSTLPRWVTVFGLVSHLDMYQATQANSAVHPTMCNLIWQVTLSSFKIGFLWKAIQLNTLQLASFLYLSACLIGPRMFVRPGCKPCVRRSTATTPKCEQCRNRRRSNCYAQSRCRTDIPAVAIQDKCRHAVISHHVDKEQAKDRKLVAIIRSPSPLRRLEPSRVEVEPLNRVKLAYNARTLRTHLNFSEWNFINTVYNVFPNAAKYFFSVL